MDRQMQRKIEDIKEMIESLRHDARFSDGVISAQFTEAAQHLELSAACLECTANLKSI